MSDPTTQVAVMNASKNGVQTTEFKGKTSVQLMFAGILILQQFGVDVALDEQTALLIIAGLEATYALGRSIVKAFQLRFVASNS